MDITRELLRDRHRLSDRQIDDWLGKNSDKANKADRLQNLQRIDTFLEVTNTLTEDDIWFVNLKGPLLSQRIYGDSTYRAFRDFDILIKPDDVNQVIDLLKEQGFEARKFKWPKSGKKQDVALSFLNQFEMINYKTGIILEIHWKLFSARITKEETLEKLIRQNTKILGFGGQKLTCFSIEFELFYLVVHGGIHAWFRLKWLVDIHEIVNRKPVDWKKFKRIVSMCHAQVPLDICNIILKEFFPHGKRLPMAGTHATELGAIAIEQCKQPEGDPHATRSNTLKLIRYRMKLFPYSRYKMDVLQVITFCKTDLKYDWLPPFKFAFYLFRPVGYLLRGLKILD